MISCMGVVSCKSVVSCKGVVSLFSEQRDGLAIPQEYFISFRRRIMAIPVPLMVGGRIIRRFKKRGAIGQSNAKTLAELDMEKFPFTSPLAKRIFRILQRRGVIQNEGDKYFLSK